MSRIAYRVLRNSAAALVAVVLGASLCAAPGAALAAGEEQAGQQGEVWNLGIQQNGRRYPTTLSAHNRSCGGKRDFEITIEGEAAQFLGITGPTVLEKIKRGETKTTDAVLDLNGVAPGVYNEGTVAVRCLNCPPRCHQDYTVLKIHLTVAGPEEEPPAPTDASVAEEEASAEFDVSVVVEEPSADTEVSVAGGEATPAEALAPGTSTQKAFTDTDGNGWNYCSGRCTKVVESIRRADGSTSKVVRVKRGTCDPDCSCVLFKYSNGKLEKKLEVSEDKGYVDIGQDNVTDYSLRCCEED